jgi:hypothetical protein
MNPHLDEQNHARVHFSELQYMEALEARGGLLHLDNVAVDIEQTILRTFQCDTGYCVRCARKDGAVKFRGSCCTDLEVNLTRHETDQIRALARLADERLRLAPSDPLRDVVHRITAHRFTERTAGGETALRHLRTGRCALSWMDGATLRCALNTLCDRLGEPLARYKAEPCYLFPLHYAEYAPQRYLVTVLCAETQPWIGSDAYIGKLRCLGKPQPGAPPVYVSLRDEIVLCLGEALYEALDAAARPILERAGLRSVETPWTGAAELPALGLETWNSELGTLDEDTA